MMYTKQTCWRGVTADKYIQLYGVLKQGEGSKWTAVVQKVK